jgi:hypothetical protein
MCVTPSFVSSIVFLKLSWADDSIDAPTPPEHHLHSNAILQAYHVRLPPAAITGIFICSLPSELR